MSGIIALNQILKINLGWNEFCYCYAVKQNSADSTYYFSHRETTTVLVTDLPKSEKGRKDNLISLTGDWERRPGDTDTHVVPRIKAASTHKSTGLKPRDSAVNHLDLKMALDLPHEQRKWRQLRDHPAYLELHGESKIADESQASLPTASRPPHNSLGSYARNVEADRSEMTADSLSSSLSYKKQKLMNPHSTTPTAANLGSKDQEGADLSKTEIKIDQLLTHESHEEVLSRLDQTFGKFKNEVQGIVHPLLNDIKELKAIIARKDKEIEELKLVEEKEPVRAGIPGATNTESLKKAREETNDNSMIEFIEHLKGHINECFQKFSADMAKLQEAQQPQPQLPLGKLVDDLSDIVAKATEPQRPRFHTWLDSSSSGNNEPLARQNQNDHGEGAAAATLRQNQNDHTEGAAAATLLPNVSLHLCTRAPSDQNEYPGNHHHYQQQTIEPSLNYYNLSHPFAAIYDF